MITVTREVIEEVLGVANTMGREDIADLVPPALVDAIVEIARPADTRPITDLTRIRFEQGIRGMESSAFATIGTFTTIKDGDLIKPKTNGTSGMITKLALTQVIVNCSYANMVNNQMAREVPEGKTFEEYWGEQFESAPRTWGTRLIVFGKPRGIVEHTNKNGVFKTYLDTARLRSLGKSYWYFHGQPIEWDEIAHMFHPFRESKRQQQEKKINWRTYGFESLQTVAITPNQEPRFTYRYNLVD